MTTYNKKQQINHRCASIIAEQIIHQFNPATVIDIGCGPGRILHELRKCNISIQGIDSLQSVLPFLEIPRDEFMLQDITATPLLYKTHDLALCFSIIDNLPVGQWYKAARFIRSLATMAITIVSNHQRKWTTIMRQNHFKENESYGELFRLALNPQFDESMAKLFNHAQVFQRKG